LISVMELGARMIRSASLGSASMKAQGRTLAQHRDRVLQPLSLTKGDAKASYANTGLSASRSHVPTGNAQSATACQPTGTLKQTGARGFFAH
jgi:hypothetical protein